MSNQINIFNDEMSTYAYDDKDKSSDNFSLSPNSYIGELNSSEYIASNISNINIFHKVWKKLGNIKNENIKEFIYDIINTFQIVISEKESTENEAYLFNSNYLPSFLINEDEDESVLLELILTNSRIGIALEPEINNSFWFFVYKNNNETSQAVRPFTKDLLLLNTTNIINIAYDNT